jgi:hypothetical protein
MVRLLLLLLHYYKFGILVTGSATTSFSIMAFLLVAGILDDSNLIFSSTTYTNKGLGWRSG